MRYLVRANTTDTELNWELDFHSRYGLFYWAWSNPCGPGFLVFA